MKTKLHIVGLRYYGWCGRMAEIFAPEAAQGDTWLGKLLFLQHDQQCAEDPHAVMAWTLTEPVGHVCKLDQPYIAPVLEQGLKEVVTARIVDLDPTRRALVVEPLDELPELTCRAPEPEPWAWDGPVMPLPMIWAKADHLGRIMSLLARGELPWGEEMEEVVSQYMQYTVTDLSGDAYAARSLLAHTLLQSTRPRLADIGHELLAVMDHMGSTEQMTAWYNLLTSMLTDGDEARSLAARYAETDVQQVLTALRSFPLEIGREWLAGNSGLFARRLYYVQMPRTRIMKLLSLIVLYTSACRRVPPLPVQSPVGVTVSGVGQMQVGTLDNHGTLLSIEQARILPNH